MNMDKFENVEFQFNTLQPPPNPNPDITNLCDENGDIIGVRKIYGV